MASLFTLMIDDIVISEADFSAETLSQCQQTECPTEPISALFQCKPPKLAIRSHHNSDEPRVDKLSLSPLSCQRKSQNQNPTKKWVGKVAWALFEEDGDFDFGNEEGAFLAKRMEVEKERGKVVTSEFSLDFEDDAHNPLKMRLRPVSFDLAVFQKENPQVISAEELATPKGKNPVLRDHSSRLTKKTIKKISRQNVIRTPKLAGFCPKIRVSPAKNGCLEQLL